MFREEIISSLKPLDGVVMTESDKEEELDATKAMMEKIKEENKKLKLLLSTILNNYNSLQTHVSNVLRQHPETSMDLNVDLQDNDNEFGVDISLRLGRSEQTISKKEERVNKISEEKEEGSKKRTYAMSLGFQIQSCEASKLDESCRNVASHVNAENKSVSSKKDVKKTGRNENHQDVMEEHEQSSVKKTRVCVKATCEDPSINDGCQWRKYGQKTAKTNPLPRAYYRCSMSTNCPVRKQVQRSGEEETAAYITTYEGTHDHPLPMEATHMAAGTSAAASLLKSGSTTSSSTSTTSASLNHFFPFHHFSISTTNAHPTVTLDLTRPNYTNQLPSSSSSFSLNFSSPDPPPPSSNDRTLSFSGLRTQADPLSTDLGRLSHRTRLSGQQ